VEALYKSTTFTFNQVTLVLTFNLDGGRGLGTAGRRGGFARVGGRVVGTDDVERQSAQAVLVLGCAVRHGGAVLEPFDQRRRRVALQTTLEREPASSPSSSVQAAAAAHTEKRHYSPSVCSLTAKMQGRRSRVGGIKGVLTPENM